MTNIIEYDFKKREKITKYVVTTWKCYVCRKAYEFDSRASNNISRVVFREATSQRAEESICMYCCLAIKAKVEEQNWEYDKE